MPAGPHRGRRQLASLAVFPHFLAAGRGHQPHARSRRNAIAHRLADRVTSTRFADVDRHAVSAGEALGHGDRQSLLASRGAGDCAHACSLAGLTMRQAFGNSLQRFQRDLSSLQRIRFERVAIVARDQAGVTIDIRSVATHLNRVDRCTGTLRATRRPQGGWLVEPAGIRCTAS